MKTLVIGLGNPVLTDDGVGLHVAAELRPRLQGRDGVEVEDCCRGGLALMEQLIGYDRAIIVDAIRTGSDPGTLHFLTPDSIPTQHSASGHDANLPTALALGREAGAHLPTNEDILLIGVEADDVENFNEECTPPVRAAIPQAVKAVMDALDSPRSK
ncbi:MAG: hydrogenase maturation protease [Planctomycetota bacterium]|jgi:hydrogenase maturation protease